ncbi:hypothetical protein [Amycolatopsis sp. SID8362]|uniref:hypothetical protein n=1 Tax=Amycolatopsis sp. SID8362 TaxID=2690346 RepID=UPI00136C7DE3|nr:hypothetical protein [Amycolatopsis sp. SID8362]NBH06240.1 hypothetical protein [Amycolatopsis sp. SID8362]NED42939.1 hypothetical protein [Amycolatopsis sp. SID8362]
MGDLTLAGSKFNGSDAEYFGTLAVVGGIVLVVLAVVLVVKRRLEKNRRTAVQQLTRQLDGRPIVYVPYADCPLPVPQVSSTAHARGYAMTPNPTALRYEFAYVAGRPGPWAI